MLVWAGSSKGIVLLASGMVLAHSKYSNVCMPYKDRFRDKTV